MSSTSSRPRRPRETVRTVTAGGRILRVSVREGSDAGTPPLLLLNGIGASLEVLQPFVDALHPRRTVVRFDVPGVGGSPRPLLGISVSGDLKRATATERAYQADAWMYEVVRY